ncbi:MAG: hypothetical protein BWK76_19905 [Desulfobulbaceae bacterium A2]|nr:MAG: hypothetical protein BWK76_19905 [Desulfobulbaceae bacterium A2]
MALLEARSVTRDYAARTGMVRALPPVSLCVDPGEMLVIRGPSGAGKTTLLHLLSGLDRPSAGEVLFRGRSLSTMSAVEIAHLRNRFFGFIFQQPHLLPDRTVLENVVLPCHYGPDPRAANIAGRALRLLEAVGLAPLATRYPATLSGGEMQRLAFARALMMEPEVIFADEPTGSLDGENSSRLLDMLASETEQGRAVVLVTHDPQVMGRGTSFCSLVK